MNSCNGLAVPEKLKAIEAHRYVPVLVITAQPAYKLRALKSGAKDFISKPIDLTEAKARIHNMLEVRLRYEFIGVIRKSRLLDVPVRVCNFVRLLTDS